MTFRTLLAAADRVTLNQMGDPVRYQPTAGDPVDVVGHFDAMYVRADAGRPGVSTTGPAVFLLLSDLAPSDPSTDPDPTITIYGVAYRRREAKPDGMGGVLVMLFKA